MSASPYIFVFSLAEQRFALPVSTVDRVVRAVEVTPLADAPKVALGIINVEGVILPVIGMRKKMGLPGLEEIKVSDHFVIARMPRRVVALVVNDIHGVVLSDPAHVTRADEILPGVKHVRGVLRMPDGLIFVHDLEGFLSLDEEESLELAMKREEDAQ